MDNIVKVYGVPLSPYVKKVTAVLRLKGISYEIDPVIPTKENQTPELLKKSPLGKVPFIEHQGLSIPDSSVICDYLNQIEPNPPIYPESASDRAKALWLEEYADVRLVQVFGGGIFYERVVKPQMLKEETDESVVKQAMEVGVPEVCEYLESVVPADGFIFGEQLYLADIAIASQYLNSTYANFKIDAARWPKLAAYMERVLNTTVMLELKAIDIQAFQQAA